MEILSRGTGADRIKNLETIIGALPMLSLPLIVSGPISRKRQQQLLQQLPAKEYNKLIFCGYQDNQVLAWLYQHAELFLFPSLNEGFGYPPLEALRCGCPVLVSRLSALPEILGDAAYYVDSATATEAWADRITALINDGSIRSTVIERSVRVLNRYTIDLFRQNLLEVYASFL